MISLADFLGSLIRVIIKLAEASLYYHLQQKMRICLHLLYLLALTIYSVRWQTFHYSVSSSLI
jgi:hypothetical protein